MLFGDGLSIGMLLELVPCIEPLGCIPITLDDDAAYWLAEELYGILLEPGLFPLKLIPRAACACTGMPKLLPVIPMLLLDSPIRDEDPGMFKLEEDIPGKCDARLGR